MLRTVALIRSDVPSKRQYLQDLHVVTSQMTAFSTFLKLIKPWSVKCSKEVTDTLWIETEYSVRDMTEQIWCIYLRHIFLKYAHAEHSSAKHLYEVSLSVIMMKK